MLGLQALYRMFVFDMIDLLFLMPVVERFFVWIFALASTYYSSHVWQMVSLYMISANVQDRIILWIEIL